MRSPRTEIKLALIAAVAIVGSAIGMANAGERSNDLHTDHTTPRPGVLLEASLPPWVNADGLVEFDKMPEYFPMFDSNGGVCGYIRAEDLFGPSAGLKVVSPNDDDLRVTREIFTEEDGTTTEVVNVLFGEPGC
jgi:hypothetical protein